VIGETGQCVSLCGLGSGRACPCKVSFESPRLADEEGENGMLGRFRVAKLDPSQACGDGVPNVDGVPTPPIARGDGGTGMVGVGKSRRRWDEVVGHDAAGGLQSSPGLSHCNALFSATPCPLGLKVDASCSARDSAGTDEFKQ